MEIASEWLDRLYPPRDDEQAQLDENDAGPLKGDTLFRLGVSEWR
ncbi:MAG: hypothetical protein WBN97_02385 [Parvibaculum sp.]